MTAALKLEHVAREWLRTASLEEMLTHPMLFGLETATPLQRAICRVAEGRALGSLADDPSVSRQLGGNRCPVRPDELGIIAGVRGGKSLIAGAMLVHACVQADLSGLGPGDNARAVIISAKKDNAKSIYRQVAGRMKASPILRSALLSDPDNSASSFWVRHSSGLPVEVIIQAASVGGLGGTSFWLVMGALDEIARMKGGQADGEINWAAQRNAMRQRIRPGGYMCHMSSPLGEIGPAYELVQEHWQHPSESWAVFRGRGDELNPTWWTPERIEKAKRDPDSYRTDFQGEFSAEEAQLFHGDHLTLCTRESDADLPRVYGASYTAAMDPATRGNAWTLGIFTREGQKRVMAARREWIGSTAKPLDPEAVIREVAELCRQYGVTRVDTDQWSGDALSVVARNARVKVGEAEEPYPLVLAVRSHTDVENAERYLHVRTLLAQGLVSLPKDAQMRSDLVRVRKRTTNKVTVSLVKTADGRHCDWAPTVVAGVCRYINDVDAPPANAPKVHPDVARVREAAERALRPRSEEDW